MRIMQKWERDIIMRYVYPKTHWLIRKRKWLPIGIAHHPSYKSDEWFIEIGRLRIILEQQHPLLWYRK